MRLYLSQHCPSWKGLESFMHQRTVRAWAVKKIDSFTVAFLCEWYCLGNECTPLLPCLAQLHSSILTVPVSQYAQHVLLQWQ